MHSSLCHPHPDPTQDSLRHFLYGLISAGCCNLKWVTEWVVCCWELGCSAFLTPCWFQMIPLWILFQFSRWFSPGSEWLRHLNFAVPTKNPFNKENGYWALVQEVFGDISFICHIHKISLCHESLHSNCSTRSHLDVQAVTSAFK